MKLQTHLTSPGSGPHPEPQEAPQGPTSPNPGPRYRLTVIYPTGVRMTAHSPNLGYLRALGVACDRQGAQWFRIERAS